MKKGAFWAYFLSVLCFVVTLVIVIKVGGQGHAAPQLTPGRDLSRRLIDGIKDPVGQILLQVLLIVTAAQATGYLFKRLGQPAVIGEMFAGIALGPSLFGALAPSAMAFVFPTSGFGGLSILSQLGILLFMFVVGIELDETIFKSQAHTALVVSHVSILVPFAIGTVSALWLYNSYAGANAAFLPFALFMGISMSITAFPVLARILQERGLVKTPTGTTVLASAAIDDVTAWCGLAVIVALARARHPLGAASTVLMSSIFVLIAFKVVKPLLAKVAERDKDDEEPSVRLLTVSILTAFAMAFATQVIGVHAFFGAFIAGVIVPRKGALVHALHTRLHSLSTIILVPVFFAFTGLRTQLGLLHTPADWITCAIVLLIAVVAKFGSSTLAGRAMGLPWRDSMAIGVLMNTRGLVELIALNLGLDLGVLSPKMFSILVVMALTTTFMTGPALSLLRLRDPRAPQAVPNAATS